MSIPYTQIKSSVRDLARIHSVPHPPLNKGRAVLLQWLAKKRRIDMDRITGDRVGIGEHLRSSLTPFLSDAERSLVGATSRSAHRRVVHTDPARVRARQAEHLLGDRHSMKELMEALEAMADRGYTPDQVALAVDRIETEARIESHYHENWALANDGVFYRLLGFLMRSGQSERIGPRNYAALESMVEEAMERYIGHPEVKIDYVPDNYEPDELLEMLLGLNNDAHDKHDREFLEFLVDSMDMLETLRDDHGIDIEYMKDYEAMVDPAPVDSAVSTHRVRTDRDQRHALAIVGDPGPSLGDYDNADGYAVDPSDDENGYADSRDCDSDSSDGEGDTVARSMGSLSVRTPRYVGFL